MEWIDIFTMKVYRVLLIQIKYLTTYRSRHSLSLAGWNKMINDNLKSPGVNRPDLIGKIKVYAHKIEDRIK